MRNITPEISLWWIGETPHAPALISHSAEQCLTDWRWFDATAQTLPCPLVVIAQLSASTPWGSACQLLDSVSQFHPELLVLGKPADDEELAEWIERGVTSWLEKPTPTLVERWLVRAAARVRACRLAQAHSLAQKVLEHFPDDYFLVNRQGIFVWRVPHFEQLETGRSVVGLSMADLMPPAMFEACWDLGARAWLAGETLVETVEHPLLREQNWLRVSATPIDDSLLLVGVHNITSQVQQRESLQWHQRLLSLIASMTDTGYFEWQRASDQVWISPCLARLLHLGNDAIEISRSDAMEQLIVREDIPAVKALLEQGLREGSHPHAQVRIKRGDGEVRVGWGILEPIRSADGSITRISGVFHDISDQAIIRAQLDRCETELNEVDRISAMGLLSSQIAHQLNQPLFSITNYAEACRLQLEQIPPHEKLTVMSQWLERIIDQARSTGESLRRMTRWLQRRLPSYSPQDLREILREAISVQDALLKSHQVSVELQVPEDAYTAPVDRILMRQLISHLVVNAVEAMSETEVTERRLLLCLNLVAGAVELTVEDRGRGLSPEQFPKLCQPFVTTRPESLGVGLSIAKAIAESVGGRLWAEEVSVGARLKVRIPMAIEESSSPTTSEDSPSALNITSTPE